MRPICKLFCKSKVAEGKQKERMTKNGLAGVFAGVGFHGSRMTFDFVADDIRTILELQLYSMELLGNIF